MQPSSLSSSRPHWSPQERARIVHRYLHEGIPLSQLARETGAAPKLIGQWCQQILAAERH